MSGVFHGRARRARAGKMSETAELLSGDEAIALAALHAGVRLGTGYPGTPSTEILETFDRLGGRAQWSPNEKVALEVALGAAFAGARALVTMKHVGLNVAADPLFTAAYTDVDGGLVVVSADDPGMASSQNEQDNRHYAARRGACPCWSRSTPRRPTTSRCSPSRSPSAGTSRCCCASPPASATPRPSCAPRARRAGRPRPAFARDIPARVMIPAYAKPAHRRLRQKLAEIAAWNDAEGPNRVFEPAAPALGHRHHRHRRRARPRGRAARPACSPSA